MEVPIQSTERCYINKSTMMNNFSGEMIISQIEA